MKKLHLAATVAALCFASVTTYAAEFAPTANVDPISATGEPVSADPVVFNVTFKRPAPALTVTTTQVMQSDSGNKGVVAEAVAKLSGSDTKIFELGDVSITSNPNGLNVADFCTGIWGVANTDNSKGCWNKAVKLAPEDDSFKIKLVHTQDSKLGYGTTIFTVPVTTYAN
ncbi:hypothetical protein ABM398_002679 [Salmonella enterica]